MKYSRWFGIAAAIVLVFACFLPWTWHPDLNKHFTGFFSEGNMYGKPGKLFIILALCAIIFFAIPKLWAKRWNLAVSAIITALALKNFIIFSGCYRGICPEKKIGLWLMLLCSIAILVMALFPDIKLLPSKEKD